MNYVAKHDAIEAEKVLLSGQDLFAVAVDGAAHLVTGDVFRLFFNLKPGREAIAAPVKEAKPRKVKPLRKVAKPRTPRTRPDGGMTITDAVLKALGEAARTGPEVADRVVELVPGASSATVGTLLSQLRDKNKVGKGGDMKWRLTGVGQ